MAMRYDWERFWYPREGHPRLGDQGFLSEPTQFGGALNPDLCSLEQVSLYPCLGLLGEPGAGKTTTLQSAESSLRDALHASGNELLFVDLRAVGSEITFDREVLEHPNVLIWRAGAHVLHVLLDGFDECLLRVPVLTARLLRALTTFPRERLRLWIACRTGEWPATFEKELRSLWGDPQVGVFMLAPLGRREVVQAVEAHGLNATSFVQQVIRADAAALAMWPITLEFLLDGYEHEGRLVLSRTALYRRGCRRLCEDSEQRREAGLCGNLSATQRFAVAERIAAVLVFGGRTAVVTGPELGENDLEDIGVSELAGGRERIDDTDAEVTEAAVLETLLQTPLLSFPLGPKRFGFSHQTFAEFLAAAYLVDHDLPVDEVMRLLVHPEDAERRVVPQLHGVAAWLASMRSDVFGRLVEVEPDILLRSDASTATSELREELVASLLHLTGEEAILPRPIDMTLRYVKLAHPRMENQLRTVLADGAKTPRVRELAIDIAGACEVHGLASDLATIALTTSEPQQLRESAARTVARLSSPAAKARLKPLLRLPPEEDPDDQLKGYALLACWPDHLTTTELLGALTPQQEEPSLGSYWEFLRHAPTVPVSGLPEALDWIHSVASAEAHRARSPNSFVTATIVQAFLHLDAPGVEEPFLNLVVERLRTHQPIAFDPTFDAAVEAQPTKRRGLAEKLVRRVASVDDAIAILRSRPRLLRADDLEWLLMELRAVPAARQPFLSELVVGVADVSDPLQRDLLLVVRDGIPALAERLRWIFGPIQLKSDIADAMKAHYEASQTVETGSRRPRELKLQEVVELLLAASEGGRPEAFARLAFELSRGTGAQRDSSLFFCDDFTVLPAWDETDERTRTRVVTAARAFLFSVDLATETWLGTTTTPGEVLAGYQALALLRKEAQEQFVALPSEVWRRWASVTVGLWFNTEEHASELIEHAHRHAPAEVIEAVKVILERDLGGPGGERLLARLGRLWGTKVANLVREATLNASTGEGALRVLLPFLIEINGGAERPLVEQIIRQRGPAPDRRAEIAAATLLTHSVDGGWPVVWPEIQCDPTFGSAVLTEVAGRIDNPYSPLVAGRLGEEQLGDLFEWMAKEFPRAEDPDHKGAYWPGIRDQIKHLRDSLVVHLRARGTRRACQVLEGMVTALPTTETTFLRYSLLEAQAKTRAATWARPQPRDIIRIVRDRAKRLVRSGSELRDVVVESLDRLQARLQGETPEASLMWNEYEGKLRPRKENLLSDYVKNRLEDDLRGRGIVLNREVEIRKGLGAGERTDIIVTALSPAAGSEEFGAISLVIETKGCWNPGLESDMGSQLVGRYLRENTCQEGIYLVLWFDPESWDQGDERRRRVAARTRVAVEEQLQKQAAALSRDGVAVNAVVLDASLRHK